jgi:hypothetical protein
VLELEVEADPVHALEDLVAFPVDSHFQAAPDAFQCFGIGRHGLVLSFRLLGGSPESALRYPG